MSTSSSNLDLKVSPVGAFDGVPSWKRELNERLQATRTRHPQRTPEQVPLPSLEHLAKTESRASKLAAKVAERYANTPSYREILAAEARAAAAAAEAAATAARQACVAAEAILAGLESPNDERSAPVPAASAAPQASKRGDVAAITSPDVRPSPSLHPKDRVDIQYPALGSISNPFEEALVAQPQPLPVNLIEFPRELVAARKARPRLAEGPLRESSEEMARDYSQLRIFEVEPENICKAVEIEGAAPEWSSIRLDAKPAATPPDAGRSSAKDLPFKVAPLEDRLMAATFDVALVLLAFVVFVLVFSACTAHPPSGKPALFAAALVLGGLFVLYQYLSFRFTDGTPGMRYAKIALCTFEDENPTRKAMRRRILFLLLSAAPVGLGFAWAWFDVDRLGWHDRLSRMYQRSYR